jgi:hypothetical protein
VVKDNLRDILRSGTFGKQLDRKQPEIPIETRTVQSSLSVKIVPFHLNYLSAKAKRLR